MLIARITGHPPWHKGGAWRRQAPPSVGIGGSQDQPAGGSITLSMTWMTPFDAITSGVTTLAVSFRYTVPSFTEMPIGDPSTEAADVSPTTLSAVTEPGTTWNSRIFLRAAGSLRRPSSVPAGSAAKAASVGANTVKGPLPSSVSARPAALTAVTRVLNDPASVAVSTMSLVIAAADAEGAVLPAAVLGAAL